MRRVIQEITDSDDPKVYRSSIKASIASIVGVLTTTIPDVYTHGLKEYQTYWHIIDAWLYTKQLRRVLLYNDDQRVLNNATLAVGLSTRVTSEKKEVAHAVVYKNGVLLFDPHPSNDGLSYVSHHYLIKKY